jgi:hypothetical protein
MKLLFVFPILIWIGSCATQDECSWAKRIVTNDADQLTRPTKEQIVAHNRKVLVFCR